MPDVVTILWSLLDKFYRAVLIHNNGLKPEEEWLKQSLAEQRDLGSIPALSTFFTAVLKEGRNEFHPNMINMKKLWTNTDVS